MTFSVVLDRDADGDVAQVVAWLDEFAPEQADRFVDDLAATLTAIGRHAMLRPELIAGSRRESMRRFPYHVWYSVIPEIRHAEVFAVLHFRRGPDALGERL